MILIPPPSTNVLWRAFAPRKPPGELLKNCTCSNIWYSKGWSHVPRTPNSPCCNKQSIFSALGSIEIHYDFSCLASDLDQNSRPNKLNLLTSPGRLPNRLRRWAWNRLLRQLLRPLPGGFLRADFRTFGSILGGLTSLKVWLFDKNTIPKSKESRGVKKIEKNHKNPAIPVLRFQKRCWSQRWSHLMASWPLLQPIFMITWTSVFFGRCWKFIIRLGGKKSEPHKLKTYS